MSQAFNCFTTEAQLLLIKKTVSAGYKISQLVNAKEITYKGTRMVGTVHIMLSENVGFSINISKKDIAEV